MSKNIFVLLESSLFQHARLELYHNVGLKWKQSEASPYTSITLLFHRMHNLQKVLLYSTAQNILFQIAALAFMCPVGKKSLSSFQTWMKVYSTRNKYMSLYGEQM